MGGWFLSLGDGLDNLFWWVAILSYTSSPVSFPHTARRHVPGILMMVGGYGGTLWCYAALGMPGEWGSGNVKRRSL